MSRELISVFVGLLAVVIYAIGVLMGMWLEKGKNKTNALAMEEMADDFTKRLRQSEQNQARKYVRRR